MSKPKGDGSVASTSSEKDVGAVKDTKAAAENALEAKLSAAEKQVQSKEGLLTQLISKPGVRDLLTAEQAGRSVSVVDNDELTRLRAAAAKSVESAESVVVSHPVVNDEMSNTEVAQSILASVSDLVKDGVASAVKDATKDVNAEVVASKTFRDNATRQKVEDQIKACESAHPEDFKALIEPMNEIHSQLTSVGPTIEDIYALAKARNSDTAPAAISSEKPSGIASRKPKSDDVSVSNVAESFPGSVGFKHLLNDYLAKKDM